MRRGRLQVYFGHGRSIYGTEKAKEMFGIIQKKYPKSKIIDPETIPQNSLSVDYCFHAIEKCDVVCFVPELEVGYGYTLHRGQAAELLFAMSLNKKIEVFYP